MGRSSTLLSMIFLLSYIVILSNSQSIVKTLPGFPGDLPFKLETGYVGVGENEDVQLFYYFAESERNPEKDPLILWLTGGPGCSALRPFFYQIGPVSFDYSNSRDDNIKLELNPNSWTKMANVLFLDQPVGTGFSYAKTWETSRSSDTMLVAHCYDFIRKWLMDHPKFLNNPLYISGISYLGLVIPIVALEIYNGNERGSHPLMNIEGYIICSPLTDKFIDFNSRVKFAHRNALLSDELYKTTKCNCHGNYLQVKSNNKLCQGDLQRVQERIRKINFNQIFEPLCDQVNPEPYCREANYIYSEIWANKKVVQQALHIREGTIERWKNCNQSMRYTYGKNDSIYYSYNLFSSLGYHEKLLSQKCRALIFSGDLDMIFPYVGTVKWISTLNLTIESNWNPWFVNGQVAGYESTYSHDNYSLKYATVKGAGHSAPEYKPRECLVMVDRWLASQTQYSDS